LHLFTHIVFFRLKAEADKIQVKDWLLQLQGKIPELLDIEVGIDQIRSPRSYDVALVTRFQSQADMGTYQIHPAHQEVLKRLQTVVESSASVDYDNSIPMP
jgi:hypothetical protein